MVLSQINKWVRSIFFKVENTTIIIPSSPEKPLIREWDWNEEMKKYRYCGFSEAVARYNLFIDGPIEEEYIEHARLKKIWLYELPEMSPIRSITKQAIDMGANAQQ